MIWWVWCKGFGAELRRVVINDVDEGTYYARIFLEMENELGRKLWSWTLVLAILWRLH